MHATVRLVPSQPAFAALFLRWRADLDARRFNPYLPLTLEDARARLASAGHDLTRRPETGEWRWFVVCEGEAEPVGSVALSGRNDQMRTAEIGYQIDARFQRRGIGTRAVRALVGKIFGETDLRKLLAFVHEHNTASCRLLERLGFRREGLLREHFLIEGEPVNEAVYGLLRRESSPPAPPAG